MNIPRQLIEIGFNKRSLTYEDFENLCARIGVVVFRTDAEEEGMHFERRGRPIIVLSTRLSGFMLLWVAWHELAHVLLHPTDLRFFVRGTEDKFEAQANAIAVCCVLPKTTLRKILVTNDPDYWLYPRELMKRRCEVCTAYGV